MFGTQTRVFASSVAVLLLAATACATQYTISADFVETKETLANSSLSGKLYYLYDNSKPANSRLTQVYNLPNGLTVTNLYHYEDGAMYSQCPVKCTGIKKDEVADPWYVTDIYTKGSAEDGCYWYTHKDPSANDQVKRILMTESTAPSASGYRVSKVEFKDGRTVTLTNFKYNPSDASDKFTRAHNCPKPTCPIYADIVFVLDYSGSVSSSEWSDAASFVVAVMESFTFGDDGVAAAALQFNGNGATGCGKKTISGCGSRYSSDCSWSTTTIPGSKTAKMLAPSTGNTVSTDQASLINIMKKTRTPSGQTCQGFGLELAQRVLDNSPRRKQAIAANRPEDIPNPIIIAVTDGVDFCPNKTKREADTLRTQYGALVVEVGVGLSSCGDNYDKNFLKSVASKMGSGNNSYYYDVDDYSAIKTVADDLFKPMCEAYTTDCPNCKGFCGCGSCYCPTCDDTHSTCYDNKCQERDGTSTGCVTSEITCGTDADVCHWYDCDGSKEEGNGRCTPVTNDCAALKASNPGTCRVVSCLAPGGCRVDINEAPCKAISNNCEQYECTPIGETPEDLKTGCRLVLNKTAEKEQELKDNGKIKCFRPVCESNGTTREVDTCVSSRPKCAESACTESEGSWSCKETEVNDPTDKCTTYTCTTEGWEEKDKQTTATCIEFFGGEDKVKCGNVYCNPKEGCVNETIENCASECTIDDINGCISSATQLSNYSTETCILGTCMVIKGEGTQYSLGCNYDASVNCYEYMAAELEKLNKANPDRCYNAICNNGQCSSEYEQVPDSMPLTQCMKPICQNQGDGTWKWEYVPTEVNLTCKTDDCTYRICLADEGCHEEDTCMNETTDCMIYSCVIDESDGQPKCVGENQLITTNCTVEVCDENNKKQLTVNLTSCTQNNTNKCLIPSCVYDADTKTSYCTYTPKAPTGTDVCTVYTCDPDTGLFDQKEKCHDGLFCTEDICTVFGECKFNPIRCSDELPMESYPCFEARCKEGESEYSCIRKLIPGAFIDVCGNCIKEETSDRTESDSGSFSESNVDPLECTQAPPKPLLTEGLAAATIALIILAAVLIGAGITASGVVGTKSLIDRAKNAKNQTAHTNPLFEGNETEMANPTYGGGD